MKVDSQVRRMTWMYVVPLSLIPVAMFIYAVHVTSGAALPMVVPVMSLGGIDHPATGRCRRCSPRLSP